MSELNVKSTLDDALISLLLAYPVFGQLVTRVGVNLVNDETVPFWGWTNGTCITINQYALELSHKQKTYTDDVTGKTFDYTVNKNKLAFVLAHEVMHLLTDSTHRGEQIGVYYDDVSDLGMHKHALWNQATDYEINSLLYHNRNQNVDNPNTYDDEKCVGEMPDWVCYNPEYKDMTAEEIYAELLKEDEKQTAGGKIKLSFFKNDSSSGSGDGNKDSEQEAGSKNSRGQIKIGLDLHKPILDDMTKSALEAKIGDIFNSAKAIGYGSTSTNRACEIATKPVPFNWKKVLCNYMRGFMKENYTWMRPSRVGIANNVILPSAGKTPKLKVGIAVDTSGSISDKELQTLMNYLFTILTQFKAFEVDVWCCSTEVHEKTWKRFTAGNKQELTSYKFETNGGTYLSSNFEFIEKKYPKDKPDVLLMFTDGYDNLNGDTKTKTTYPVLWLIVDNKNFIKPKNIPGLVLQCSIKD